MSLSYITTRICEICGFDVADDRDVLNAHINKACREIYEITDLPGSLKEITVLASADSLIALPYHVGELRNSRGYYSYEKIDLKELHAKYQYQPWRELWNNWRVVNKSPLQNCIEDATSPITITVPEADSIDVVITVTGSTINSNRVSDVVTLEAGETEVNLTKLFTDIVSITKDRANNFDITFTGLDENGEDLVLAVIPNDRLTSLYTIVDVSKVPNISDNSSGYRYVEVLYKQPLPELTTDGDEFICPGYDDAIVYKFCEYFYSDKEGMENKAYGWMLKCNNIIKQKMENTNGATEKNCIFAPNPLFNLFPKRRPIPYPLS